MKCIYEIYFNICNESNFLFIYFDYSQFKILIFLLSFVYESYEMDNIDFSSFSIPTFFS